MRRSTHVLSMKTHTSEMISKNKLHNETVTTTCEIKE